MKIVLRILALSLALLTTAMFVSCANQGDSASGSKQSGSKAASSKASESAAQNEESEQTTSKSGITLEPFTMPADGFGLEQITYATIDTGMSVAKGEGNIVYVAGWNTIRKYDYSDPLNPKLVKSQQVVTSLKNTNITSLVINGDYIYAGCRRTQANIPNPYTTNGLIIILKKSDLSIVKTAKMTFPNGNSTTYAAEAGYGHKNWDANDVKVGDELVEQEGTFNYKDGVCELNFKVSNFHLHKNMLIVNLQMRGWCIFTIDEKDPTHLTLTDTCFWGENPIIEHQGGDVYEHDGKTYYVAAGFGDGITIYDITDPTDIKEELRYNFWDSNQFDTNVKGKIHTFSLVVDYPYVYATIAPEYSMLTDKNSENYANRIMGVLTLDITDFKNVGYTISKIADADRCGFLGGDPQPTKIYKIDNYLVLNSSDKGVAVFKITNKAEPTYVKTIQVANNKHIYGFSSIGDNMLLVGEQEAPYKSYVYKVHIK